MKNRMRAALIASALFATAFIPNSVFACGSCYGAADSPATHGMNFAILSMLGITGGVLAAMTSFFLHLRKRAKAYLATDTEHSIHDDGGIR